jgi:hypothetical protein
MSLALLPDLVGRSVVRVHYFELDYGGEPEWPGDEYHVLDFGLQLDLDDGGACAFTWYQAGVVEELQAHRGPMVPKHLDADTGRVYDVTHELGWAALIGVPIEAADTVRDRAWEDQVHPYVIAWVLTFAGGGEVVIALGKRGEDGSYEYSHEDVAVFFSRAVAVRHNAIDA